MTALPSIDFFYDGKLPGPTAASIQIMRTGAAHAALGGRFGYLAGAETAAPERVVAAYGLDPMPGLDIEPFFPPNGGFRWWQTARLRWRLAARRSRGSVWMSRGPTAARLLSSLGGRETGPVFLYEMHNLAHARALERTLGRRASADELDAAKPQAIRAREGAVVQRADGLVFLTEAVAEAAAQTFAITQPGLVLPSGVDTYDPLPAPSGPPVDIVFAGKLERRKGIYDLCAALGLLPGRRMAIAGGTEETRAALQTDLHRAGIADRVELAGWINPAAVPAFLRRGRVGACPLAEGVDSVSDRFSSPMKLLQMMALGLPVIATALSPVRAIARHEHEALLVPPADPHALAAAVARLLDDPMTAQRLGEAGRLKAAAFAWERRAARLAAFAADLAADRPR